MKKRKIMSMIVAFAFLFNTLGALLPSGVFSGVVANASEATPATIIVDDFDDEEQFIQQKKNDLGFNYYFDDMKASFAYKDEEESDGKIILDNAWWLTVCVNEWPGLDLTEYSDLVLVMKGSPGSTMSLQLEHANWETLTAEKSVTVPTEIQEVKVPLNQFSDADMTKVLSLVFTSLTGIIEIDEIRFEGRGTTTSPEEPGQPGDEVDESVLVVDNFDSAAQYTESGKTSEGLKGRNDLGGEIWGNGTQVCTGDAIIISPDTTWWNLNLSATWPADFNVTPYRYLTYVVKGDSSEAKLTVWLQREPGNEESTAYTIDLTTDFQTVRIPLSTFIGIDMTKVNSIKHSFTGTVTIDEIRFEGIGLLPPVPRLVYDDFDDDDQYNKNNPPKNDLGGGYWGDGNQVVADGILTLTSVSWWDMTFGADEPYLDLRNYHYLVYRIKGAAGATIKVNLWNQFGTVSVPIPLSEDWQTVKIPLSDFTNLDKGRALKMKHNITGGPIYIDEIWFEAEEPMIVDNFDDADQFHVDNKNDLGGNYYFDENAITTCDAKTLSISDSWWMSTGLSEADLRNYTHLTFDIKGSENHTANVKIEHTEWSTVSGAQELSITTEWQTVQLPLDGFTGLNAAKALALKFEGFTGTVEIDNIQFQALKIPYKPIQKPAPEPEPEPEPETPPANTEDTLYLDDFNNAGKFNNSKLNDMGGRYWGDGNQTCDGNIVTLSGVTWWDAVLNADSTGVDLSGYNYITFVIKGTRGASMNVTLKDTDMNLASPVQNIPIKLTWNTVQIPMSSFTGVDMTKIRQLVFSGFNGVIDIDEIRFDKNEIAPPPPPVDPAPSAGTRHDLTYAPAPIDNPLKGFFPFANAEDDMEDPEVIENFNKFPHSMEWFYLPLKSVMFGYNDFDFTAVETMLDRIASRGHQAVFRFYLDYPNTEPGIPQFLLDDGLNVRDYDDFDNGKNARSICPDYNDPKLITALVNFIEALGERYDGDPRIGYITTGLIGFWGEWHTYPYDGYSHPENWMPSDENVNRILQAFDDSFNKTHILTRNPIGESAGMDLGYHDDSFAYQTLPASLGGYDWQFLGRLQSAGLQDIWKTNPIGGEVRPEIQLSMWETDPPAIAVGEDYNLCVDLTHATWMINHAIFRSPLQGEALQRALDGARRLGYEYHVPAVYYNNVQNGQDLTVGVQIQNRGVAPFYYDWQVKIGLIRNGTLVRSCDTDWEISGILPEETKGFIHTISKSELETGVYTLAMKVVNPLEAISSEAKKFRFANTEQGSDGWLRLGTITVGTPSSSTPAPAPVTTPSVEETSKGTEIRSTTTVDVTKDNAGNAKAIVPSYKIDMAIRQVNEAADQQTGKTVKSVQINVDNTSDSKSVSLDIPVSAMNTLADSDINNLTVNTGLGSMEIDSRTLDTIKNAAKEAGVDGNVSINIRTVDKDTVLKNYNDKQRKEFEEKIGNRPVYDFSIQVGSTSVTDFGGGAITVTLPYTPAEGEDPDSIIICYIDDSGNLKSVPNCKYDPVTKTLKFTVSHFSTYAVAYNRVSFSDVPENAWYYKPVSFMAARNVIVGYNNRFNPDGDLLRADFLIMIMNTFGIEADTTITDNFLDAGNKYYTPYLATAKKLGIVAGWNNKCEPEKPISRQDMFVILYNVLEKLGRLPEETGSGRITDYKDADKIAAYAKDKLKLLVETGIIVGDGQNLNPEAKATRAQAARILYSIITME